MKIVSFSDGSFAIRRRSFWTFQYVYYDFEARCNYWWSRHSRHYDDCIHSDESYVRKIFSRIGEKGVVVNMEKKF